MTPRFLPALERAARIGLLHRGFKTRAVRTGASALHAYTAAGTGDLPTTAVIHGIGSSATAFAPLLERLRPHVRRVVAPDLPGHGFSDPPVRRLTPDALFEASKSALDALIHEPMVLVGNSLGGALALRYAMASPANVRALVLLSPAGARMTEEEWRALVRTYRVQSTDEARRLLARLYHRTPWYMPVLASDMLAVMERRAVREILDTATAEDLFHPEQLGALSTPVLVLWGQSERVFPRSSLEYFREHLPAHACIEEPAGFGHCPHFDDPARLATRIVAFARSAVADSRVPSIAPPRS